MEDAGRLFRRMDAQEMVDLERATGLLIADEEDWSQEDYGRVIAYLRRKALTAIAAKMARTAHAIIKCGVDYRPFFEGAVPGGRTSLG